MPPTVLVTGANGFVGRAVAAGLRKRGSIVRPAVRAGAGAGVIAVGDIGPATDWSDALAGVDCVVHCAARVHMLNDTAADPLAAFRAVNTAGTLRLAEQAAGASVRRLVFVSSVKVNGEETPLDRPFSSDDLPRPVDAYGVSKAEAESGLFDVGAKTGLEIVVVRAPLVYGPGVKANFAAIVAAIRRGWPLPFGSVTANRRSMVALDSLVDLLALCAVHPAAPGQVFFASDGDDVSTAELIRRIARALDRNPRLLAIPSALLAVGALAVGKGAVARRLLGSLRVDIGPTHALLGWSPPVTMAEALRETVAALSRSSEKGMTTE